MKYIVIGNGSVTHLQKGGSDKTKCGKHFTIADFERTDVSNGLFLIRPLCKQCAKLR